MTELEKQRRNYVEQALHSSRMEGQEASEELKADAELWIMDKITFEEFMERTMCRIKGCEH